MTLREYLRSAQRRAVDIQEVAGKKRDPGEGGYYELGRADGVYVIAVALLRFLDDEPVLDMEVTIDQERTR